MPESLDSKNSPRKLRLRIYQRSNPSLDAFSVRTHPVYPAALTAFGLVGNVYILANHVKDVRDDLGGQIKKKKGLEFGFFMLDDPDVSNDKFHWLC